MIIRQSISGEGTDSPERKIPVSKYRRDQGELTPKMLSLGEARRKKV